MAKQLFRSKAVYVNGLPVGKPGEDCEVQISMEALTISHGGLLGGWKHAIPISDIRGSRIESTKKLTLGRILLVGILAPLWKKEQKCWIVSYGPKDFTTDLILIKLNIDAAHRSLLKTKMVPVK